MDVFSGIAAQSPPSFGAALNDQNTWLWYCCNCNWENGSGGGGMTTEIMHCPNSTCQHVRCPHCGIELIEPEEIQAFISTLSSNAQSALQANPATKPVERAGPFGSFSVAEARHRNDSKSSRKKRNQQISPQKRKDSRRPPEVPLQRFACPFHKESNHLYNAHVNPQYEKCPWPGWSRMRNLIE